MTEKLFTGTLNKNQNKTKTALGKDANTVKTLSFVSMDVFSLCINLRLFCSHMCVKDFFSSL